MVQWSFWVKDPKNTNTTSFVWSGLLAMSETSGAVMEVMASQQDTLAEATPPETQDKSTKPGQDAQSPPDDPFFTLVTPQHFLEPQPSTPPPPNSPDVIVEPPASPPATEHDIFGTPPGSSKQSPGLLKELHDGLFGDGPAEGTPTKAQVDACIDDANKLGGGPAKVDDDDELLNECLRTIASYTPTPTSASNFKSEPACNPKQSAEQSAEQSVKVESGQSEQKKPSMLDQAWSLATPGLESVYIDAIKNYAKHHNKNEAEVTVGEVCKSEEGVAEWSAKHIDMGMKAATSKNFWYQLQQNPGLKDNVYLHLSESRRLAMRKMWRMTRTWEFAEETKVERRIEREGQKIEGEMLNFVQLANILGGFQYPVCRRWAVTYCKKLKEFGDKYEGFDNLCGIQTWLYNRIGGYCLNIQKRSYSACATSNSIGQHGVILFGTLPMCWLASCPRIKHFILFTHV